MIRVLCVEDDDAVGRYIASLMASEIDIELVNVARSAPEAFSYLRRGSVDVLVLDFELYGINGIDLFNLLAFWDQDPAAATAAGGARPAVLFCTGFAGTDFDARARHLGAAGVVAKSDIHTELRPAIRAVARGDRWYDHRAEKRQSAISPGRWQILAGDGQRAVRTHLEEALPEIGCSVQVACTSDQALDALNSRSFDLLLLDQQLPGQLAGVEMWEQLMQKWPALPVLLLTPRSDLRDYRPVPSVRGVVVKPFSARTIQEEILRVLDGQPRSDEVSAAVQA